MKTRGLIDTGAILAILRADDSWHERCIEAFSSMKLPLATTAAVLTELFHLLGSRPNDLNAAWTFIRSGAVVILPITDADSSNIERLMKQYTDRPMDFADATLVHLAERESLSVICTIDHNDFETYRIKGRRKFSIFPPR
ncbi:MAG: PIN domain-containing protein [Cyanobacteria bacterium J06621_11]